MGLGWGCNLDCCSRAVLRRLDRVYVLGLQLHGHDQFGLIRNIDNISRLKDGGGSSETLPKWMGVPYYIYSKIYPQTLFKLLRPLLVLGTGGETFELCGVTQDSPEFS